MEMEKNTKKRKRELNLIEEILSDKISKFGSLERFLYLVDKYSPQLSPELQQLTDLSNYRRMVIQNAIKIQKKKFDFALLIKTNISKRSWDYLASNILFFDQRIFPCYRSIKQVEKSRQSLNDVDDVTFFKYYSSKIFTIISKETTISLRNTFRKVTLMLVKKKKCPQVSTVYVKYSLWMDGATCNNRGLLFGGVKILDVTASFLSPEDKKSIISRVFINEITEGGETILNIQQYENFIYKQIVDLSPIIHPQLKLITIFCGYVTDHAVRQKSVEAEDRTKNRCGECNFVFDRQFYDGSHMFFLSFQTLLNIQEITHQNAALERKKTESMSTIFLSKNNIPTHSYDNMHCTAGHIRKLFECLISCVSASQISSRRKSLLSQIYHKIETVCKVKLKKKLSFIKAFQWRALALNLDHIFPNGFFKNKEVSSSFETLFLLLKEIIIFNYYRFNREEPHFPQLISRYSLILYLYTEYLKICIPVEHISILNDIYLHKILVVSPSKFTIANLSSFSCENGESFISTTKRVLKNSNSRWKDDKPKILKYFELSLEQSVEESRTNVFENHFIENHIFYEISLLDTPHLRHLLQLFSNKFQISFSFRKCQAKLLFNTICGVRGQNLEGEDNKFLIISKWSSQHSIFKNVTVTTMDVQQININQTPIEKTNLNVFKFEDFYKFNIIPLKNALLQCFSTHYQQQLIFFPPISNSSTPILHFNALYLNISEFLDEISTVKAKQQKNKEIELESRVEFMNLILSLPEWSCIVQLMGKLCLFFSVVDSSILITNEELFAEFYKWQDTTIEIIRLMKRLNFKLFYFCNSLYKSILNEKKDK